MTHLLGGPRGPVCAGDPPGMLLIPFFVFSPDFPCLPPLASDSWAMGRQPPPQKTASRQGLSGRQPNILKNPLPASFHAGHGSRGGLGACEPHILFYFFFFSAVAPSCASPPLLPLSWPCLQRFTRCALAAPAVQAAAGCSFLLVLCFVAPFFGNADPFPRRCASACPDKAYLSKVASPLYPAPDSQPGPLAFCPAV